MYRDRGEADREARRQREAWEREHGESFSRILRERYEATRVKREDLFGEPHRADEKPDGAA